MSSMSFPFLSFLPHHAACGILVPQPWIKPMPPAVEAWSPKHWTAREVLSFPFFLAALGLCCCTRAFSTCGD